MVVVCLFLPLLQGLVMIEVEPGRVVRARVTFFPWSVCTREDAVSRVSYPGQELGL